MNIQDIMKLKLRKHMKAVVSLLLMLTFLLTLTPSVSAEETNPVTGYWQFINSNQEIPSGGHTILSSAAKPAVTFTGTTTSVSQEAISLAIDNKELQIRDASLDSFLFIQNKQEFYIQLQDGTYFKREGDLTNLTLTTTTEIEDATLFTIELINYGKNDYASFRIYEKYRLSNLYLAIADGTLTLDANCYSGFHILAEATKATQPRFGDFTKWVRVIAVVAGIIILYLLYELYSNKKATLVTIAICGIATLGVVLFLLLFSNTQTEPGLYVLYKTTFEAEELKIKEDRNIYDTYYQLTENGSVQFSFNGDSKSAYVWSVGAYDNTVFGIQSSGSYTDGVYTILLKGYKAGTYEVPFFYYDATKDLTSASQTVTYLVTVDDKQQITSVEEKSGER